MALGTYRAADIARQLIMAAAFGNLSVKRVSVVVPLTAVNGNTVDFLEMPRGTQIVDCILHNTGDTAGAVTTFALGIAQKPGGPATKVDNDALCTAAVLTVADRLVRRNNAAVTPAGLLLSDGAYLIQGVLGGGDVGATAVTFDLELFYEYMGTP